LIKIQDGNVFFARITGHQHFQIISFALHPLVGRVDVQRSARSDFQSVSIQQFLPVAPVDYVVPLHVARGLRHRLAGTVVALRSV
jgi:hypothetical protein